MKIKLLPNALGLPPRATEGAAGWDLQATYSFALEPGQTWLMPTGISIAIEPGWVGLICPRSGLALRHSVTVLNAPGVIDPDYRGEIGVLLINHGLGEVSIQEGARIAQLLIVSTIHIITSPIEMSALEVVTELPETSRGSGGFGSTGH